MSSSSGIPLILPGRIRSDYEERIRRLKDEVRRRDDEYMADIEARRNKQSSARAKWSIPSVFAPSANKLKARLGAFDALTCSSVADADVSVYTP